MTSPFRTPLSRVRGLGSAKSGTSHFWHQRLTALANVPLVLFVVATVFSLAGASHAEAVAYLSRPWVAILLLLALGSVAWHMKLGMQMVVEDYVHGPLGLVLSILNIFFCAGLFATGGFAVLKLGFGG